MHQNLLKYPPVKAGIAIALVVAMSLATFAVLASVEVALHWPSGLAVTILAGLAGGIYVELWVFPRIKAKREAVIREAVSRRDSRRPD